MARNPDRDRITASRISLPRETAEVLAFLRENPIDSVPADVYLPWLDRIKSTWHAPGAPRREVYAVRQLVPSPLFPTDQRPSVEWEYHLACLTRWNDTGSLVDVKSLSISRQLNSSSVRYAVDLLLDKIERDMRRDGFEQLRILCNTRNRIAQYLLEQRLDFRPHPALRVAGRGTAEMIFEKTALPVYAGDPFNWLDWCLWFLRYYLSADPVSSTGALPYLSGDSRSADSRTISFQLTPRSDRIPNHLEQYPLTGIAVIIPGRPSQAMADRLLSSVETYAQFHLPFAFIEDPSGIRRFPAQFRLIDRPILMQLCRALFRSERLATRSSDGLSQAISNRVFETRFAVYLELSAVSGFLVDLRYEYFKRVIERYVSRPSADRVMIHPTAAPVGEALQPGHRIFFFVWDAQDTIGHIHGYAKVTRVTTIRNDSPLSSEDLDRTGFESGEEARAYIRNKERVLRIEFDDLHVLDDIDARTVHYGFLVNDVLRLTPSELDIGSKNRANRAVIECLRLFPAEDVGHTYLSEAQVQAILGAAMFRPASDERAVMPTSTIPPSARTFLAARSSRINALIDKFRGYYSIPRSYVTRERIEAFIGQFPSEFRDAALEMIEQVEYWNSEQISTALIEALTMVDRRLAASVSHRFVVPFGGILDSTTHIAQKLGQFPGWNVADRLESVLDQIIDGECDIRETAIAFCDDIVATGAQARDIVGQWMGEPSRLDERHVRPLSPVHRHVLQRVQCFFVCCRAFSDGQASFNMIADRWKVRIRLMAARSDVEAKYFESRATSRPLAFREFCQSVGASLLQERGSEEAKRFSLGYRDMQQLIVFDHNTPTCTVTLLWRDGTFDGRPWIPLFTRKRGKPRSDWREDRFAEHVASWPHPVAMAQVDALAKLYRLDQARTDEVMADVSRHVGVVSQSVAARGGIPLTVSHVIDYAIALVQGVAQ